jgi:hypothetical protein
VDAPAASSTKWRDIQMALEDGRVETHRRGSVAGKRSCPPSRGRGTMATRSTSPKVRRAASTTRATAGGNERLGGLTGCWPPLRGGRKS